MYMLDQSHNQIVHNMDWNGSIFQTQQSELEIIQLQWKKSKMRIWNFFSHEHKPGPFLLELIGKEYQLLHNQQFAQLMFQHYENKHSLVILDDIWNNILAWNNEFFIFKGVIRID